MAKKLLQALTLCVVFVAGWYLGKSGSITEMSAEDALAPQLFELRTYTAPEGKLDALHARFRDHTLRLFERHGIRNAGYWVPLDPELSGNTLVFLVAHPNREEAARNWDAFRADPEWVQAAEASVVDGPIVEGQESLFLVPTDYSPMW